MPWYWQEEYGIPLKAGEEFEATASEQVLVSQYGLGVEQFEVEEEQAYGISPC